MRAQICLIWSLLAFVPLPGLASDADGELRGFQITPLLGYRDGGNFDADNGANRDLQGSEVFGLVLGFATGNDAAYELLYSRQQSSIAQTGGFELTVEHLHIGGTATFNPGNVLEPFISAGIGGTSLDPEAGEDELRLSVSLGLGAVAPLSERFAVRFEARTYLVSMDGNADLFCVSGTCLVRAAGDTFFQYEMLLGALFRF